MRRDHIGRQYTAPQVVPPINPVEILLPRNPVKELVTEFTLYAPRRLQRPVESVSIDELASAFTAHGVPFEKRGCLRCSEDNIIEYQIDMTHPEHNYIIGIMLSPTERALERTGTIVSGVRCTIDYFGEDRHIEALQTVDTTIRDMYAKAWTGERRE